MMRTLILAAILGGCLWAAESPGEQEFRLECEALELAAREWRDRLAVAKAFPHDAATREAKVREVSLQYRSERRALHRKYGVTEASRYRSADPGRAALDAYVKETVGARGRIEALRTRVDDLIRDYERLTATAKATP